jgi:hypothetical protein
MSADHRTSREVGHVVDGRRSRRLIPSLNLDAIRRLGLFRRIADEALLRKSASMKQEVVARLLLGLGGQHDRTPAHPPARLRQERFVVVD